MAEVYLNHKRQPMLLTNILFMLLLTFNLSSITYSKNNFRNFLALITINPFFRNPTDEIEIKNMIMSLNPSKAIGPNSIPIKILKLLMVQSYKLKKH